MYSCFCYIFLVVFSEYYRESSNVWCLVKKRSMWLPFPIWDDIIISLFLFFTNSFHNPSSIFDIYIGIYIVSISLLKVVCKLRMCNPNRCQYDSREFVVCCLNSFCIDGRCMTTTTTTLFVPTLYIVAMYVHIHFNHVTKAKALSLHDHRYQRSIPLLAHMLLYQTT